MGLYGTNGVTSSYPSYSTYNAGSTYLPYATGYGGGADQFNPSYGHQRKPQGIVGAVAGFCTGIVNGAINAVSSLFSLKGIALALGSAALMWAAPAVAIPLLAATGLAIGGLQVFRGIATGNWEKAGEGVFTIGATLLGGKGYDKYKGGTAFTDCFKNPLTTLKNAFIGLKDAATGLFNKVTGRASGSTPAATTTTTTAHTPSGTSSDSEWLAV